MADEGMADARLQAEGELSMARLALDDGELSHAATHVANALTCDPTLPEVHELLAHLGARPDGGPELFPLHEQAFLGTVVARAHVLASRGEHAEALDLLVAAQCHEPTGPWAAVPWVLDPQLPRRLDSGLVTTLLGRLVSSFRSDPVPEELRPALHPYLTLARGAADAHSADARLLWCASLLVRRLGEPAEAAELAARSNRIQPSPNAGMALGYALRAQERWDEAERAWLGALELAPDNSALMTDLAEMLADRGRLEEGLAWTDRALRQDPGHDCAFVAACGIRFDRDSDVDHLVTLADHLRGQESGTHEAEHADRVLAEKSFRRYWLRHFPRPSESVINVLEQVMEKEAAPVGGGSLTVSAPEPPSALLAFSRTLADFSVTISDVPHPDLRATVPEVFPSGPVRAVRHRVWEYTGTVARPAVPPPSAEAARSVQSLAGRPWRHLPAAYDDAVRLSALPLGDLLGVLVHPPEPPAGADLTWPDWLRSVQAWACLGIAHHHSDQPWPDSTRREVLTDLAYGPEDWITEAALLGLVATAWVHPDTRAEVGSLVGWRFMAALQANQTRAVTIMDSLALLVLATPAMNPDVRGLARDMLAPPEDEPQGGTPPAAAQSRPGHRLGRLFGRG
ncbi:tetratricopeptide repeat protein [Actinomadura scrupuli]|uniref:tetratricopeptide repeat protein n=1 Tax=Actinomadura scrupuli TaxID=559629 RepID=UPI003D99884F